MSEAVRAGFPFDYDQDAASRESGLLCLDESLTDQSAKEEADINTIVRRFGVTGMLPEAARPVFFGDFEDVFDFQSAQNVIAEANQAFMALPADIRSRFANNPQKFVEFCSAVDGDGVLVNLEELRKMGLAVPKQEPPAEPAPLRVRVVGEDGNPTSFPPVPPS